MQTAIHVILDLLYPPKCMLCGKLLENTQELLCSGCLSAELPEYEGKAPQVPYFTGATASFFYEEPIKDAILRFKFHGMRAYAAQFADWMTVMIRQNLAGKYDMVSWVPCSRRRAWSRGFDQAELLAREVARLLDVEAVATLRKIRHNPQQSRTKNAAMRRANVLGVYCSLVPERFQGKRILLIDDVLTTGATMAECGKTLQMAGAGELVCAALAAARSNHNE